MKASASFLVAAALLGLPAVAGPTPASPLPPTLSGTGFHEAARVAFAPQYPLWSDGTHKRRWIALPPGSSIDASDPDAWRFPVGTRVWKEFGYERPVETRFIERLADGSWRFATYLWNAAGTEATLAPEDGDLLAVEGAPQGRYAIPSRTDCLACHEGPPVPVLGFSALQLAPALRELAARGMLRGVPAAMLEAPPAIAAPSASARAALGYLHGNCGHCHNDQALGGVGLVLAQQAADPARSYERAQASLMGRASEIARRTRSRNPNVRMPPLGVQRIDDEGLALVERWIHQELSQPSEKRP